MNLSTRYGLEPAAANNAPRQSLKERTWALYRERPRRITVEMIIRDTGISRGWLADFSNQRQIHVSVDKVQTLYEYLTGKKLEY